MTDIDAVGAEPRMLLGAVVAAAVLLGPPPAVAQDEPGPDPSPVDSQPPSRSEPALRERFGKARGEQLLASGDWRERARGIERLALAGTPEAVELLVESLDAGSLVRNDPRTRLLAVRALAPVAKQKKVRGALVAILSNVRTGAPETPLDRLARATAALALAKAGTREALVPLVAALIGSSSARPLVREALLAYPPKSLRALLEGKKSLPVPLITLLGELGDIRAIGPLRQQLKRKSARARAAAVLALARLDDSTPLAQARKLAKKGSDKDPEVRRLATEALVLLQDREANAAIAQLLSEPATREDGLELAALAPSPALLGTLKAVFEAPVGLSQKQRAVAGLSRLDVPQAAAPLRQALAMPELATTAAFGLATATSAEAHDSLRQALAQAPEGAARRMILRAALVRWLMLGQRVEGLEEALQAAFGSAEPADRAVGSLGLALLGLRAVEQLIRSEDPAIALAAAGATLALGPTALKHCAYLLADAEQHDRPSPRHVAGAPALLIDPTIVSTQRLADWAEAGGAVAPLAAYRLAARDSRPFRHRLEQLLGGTDPTVRIHVILGLAHSSEPDAVSLLTGAYRFEPDAAVRRAIIASLSVRSERLRQATLKLASELDPDPVARRLAQAVLTTGVRLRLRLPPAGQQVVWISLRSNRAEQRGAAAARPARLVRDDGLALPVVTAPDGVLLVPGLAGGGEVSLHLAPAATTGQP